MDRLKKVVLATLKKGGRTMSALSTTAAMQGQTATVRRKVVAELEAEGLIERVQGTSNGMTIQLKAERPLLEQLYCPKPTFTGEVIMECSFEDFHPTGGAIGSIIRHRGVPSGFSDTGE